jgi:hypothetical protein
MKQHVGNFGIGNRMGPSKIKVLRVISICESLKI